MRQRRHRRQDLVAAPAAFVLSVAVVAALSVLPIPWPWRAALHGLFLLTAAAGPSWNRLSLRGQSLSPAGAPQTREAAARSEAGRVANWSVFHLAALAPVLYAPLGPWVWLVGPAVAALILLRRPSRWQQGWALASLVATLAFAAIQDSPMEGLLTQATFLLVALRVQPRSVGDIIVTAIAALAAAPAFPWIDSRGVAALGPWGASILVAAAIAAGLWMARHRGAHAHPGPEHAAGGFALGALVLVPIALALAVLDTEPVGGALVPVLVSWAFPLVAVRQVLPPWSAMFHVVAYGTVTTFFLFVGTDIGGLGDAGVLVVLVTVLAPMALRPDRAMVGVVGAAVSVTAVVILEWLQQHGWPDWTPALYLAAFAVWAAFATRVWWAGWTVLGGVMAVLWTGDLQAQLPVYLAAAAVLAWVAAPGHAGRRLRRVRAGVAVAAAAVLAVLALGGSGALLAVLALASAAAAWWWSGHPLVVTTSAVSWAAAAAALAPAVVPYAWAAALALGGVAIVLLRDSRMRPAESMVGAATATLVAALAGHAWLGWIGVLVLLLVAVTVLALTTVAALGWELHRRPAWLRPRRAPQASGAGARWVSREAGRPPHHRR